MRVTGGNKIKLESFLLFFFIIYLFEQYVQ